MIQFRSFFIVILLLFSFDLWSQGVIKGKIKDASSGETLIGASVIIKGTTIGAITDLDGKFEIKADRNPPFVIEINFMGYQKTEVEVQDFNTAINVKLKTDNVMLQAVEIVDSRISDKQKQAPLTVESMDVLAIKEAPSGNFYESLANLKGVDMNSASLGFKVINTRGFNSTSPVRSLQLIDGVDNQSPGLNFSLGNFLGASDLDVMRVDIIAGASSAFYGPGAFNGVINMETKDPFLFKGLSASAKVGERSMQEYAVRWADAIKNKDGREVFAYKINAFYMQAYDWEANNFEPVDGSIVDRNNPGGFDAVNIYGDEPLAGGNEFTSISDISRFNTGLGRFYRTGYEERDLLDYNTYNMKFAAAAHWKPFKDETEFINAFNYSQGTTVYQGENRFSLNDIQFYQYRAEIRKKDKFFLRFYTTGEDAGNSYDAVTTAFLMNEASLSNAEWNTAYSTSWGQNGYVNRTQNLPGMNELFNLPIGSPFDSAAYYDRFRQNQDSLSAWHNQNRQFVDTNFIPGISLPRAEPGTPLFDSLFNAVTSRNLGDGGSRFFDRSKLYHLQGQYKFELEWLDIIVGGNVRFYRPNSNGTIFSDTLSYTREQRDSIVRDVNGIPTDTITETVKVDSAFTRVTNNEFGAYLGLEKLFLEDKLKANFTLRMDKNENFDAVFSPALSMVYSPNEKHTFRATFSSAVRNPTLADQFLFYNVGRAILLGNLEGIDSLITLESFDDALRSGGASGINIDTLQYFNVAPVRPEKVRTLELGYRGTWWDKIYIDAGYYFSWYEDFIGFNLGVQADFPSIPPYFPNNLQAYRVSANARDIVTTQGVNIGLSYYLKNKYAVTGNYSWNRLDMRDSEDPLIPAFNTPEHKFNIGFSGRDIALPFTTEENFGFGINYKWIQGFLFEGSPQFTGFVDTYDLVDAQINYKVPSINCTFKLGASNLLNNQVAQVYGGPAIGRLAYFSVLFDWDKK